MDKHPRVTLSLLFLVVLGFRLVLSASTPHLFSDESYYHMREVESLRLERSLQSDPLRNEPTSNSPLFAYLLTLFTYIAPPLAVYKILPNLFASSLVLITYGIAYTITHNKHSALLTAALSGFIPIYVAETYNHLSVYSLSIPLFALLIYCFLHLPLRITPYLLTLVIASLLHPSVTLFIAGLFIYVILCAIEGIPLPPEEQEVILFSSIFVVLSQFLFHRTLLLTLGTNFFRQNIPQQLLSTYFQEFSILNAIYTIDAAPFLFGLYTIRHYLFKIHDRAIYLLISMALTIGIVLWQKLLPLTVGLMFLGMIMTLLFAKSYHYRLRLFSRSRAAPYRTLWSVILIPLFLTTAVGASLHLSLAQPERATINAEYDALLYLRNHTTPDAIILSDVKNSAKIRAIAQRRVVLDSDFASEPESNERYNDIATVLSSPHITQVGERLDRYFVDYVYLSPNTPKLPAHNKQCLPLLYNKTVQIYQWKCNLETSENQRFSWPRRASEAT